MRARVLLSVAALACGAFTPSRAEAPARPPRALADTFRTCRWGQVQGRTLSIWSYACGRDMGGVRLVADDGVGGFALASTGPEPRAVVIRTFAKSPAASVAAILPAVLRATGGHKSSCRLVPHARYGDWGAAWLLEPTGAQKAAYDRANEKEPQENPCGELGVGPAGDRFFRPLPGDPSRVIYSDMGSEVQVFDLTTLRATTR